MTPAELALKLQPWANLFVLEKDRLGMSGYKGNENQYLIEFVGIVFKQFGAQIHKSNENRPFDARDIQDQMIHSLTRCDVAFGYEADLLRIAQDGELQAVDLLTKVYTEAGIIKPV